MLRRPFDANARAVLTRDLLALVSLFNRASDGTMSVHSNT